MNNLIEDKYPASYLQRGMLIESNLSSEYGTYCEVLACGFNGHFDEKKFLNIWQKLTDKHELLRAKIVESISNGYDIHIYKNVEKIEYFLHEKKDRNALINEQRSQPFVFSKAGVFRLVINKLKNGFDFLFVFHHCIADGWSVVNLLNEFVEAYVYNKPILPYKFPLYYGQYILQEINAIQDIENQRFWKEYLKDLEIFIPNWRFSNSEPKGVVHQESLQINQEEVIQLKKLAKFNNVTPEIIFLYAYIKMLSFFLNLDDIVIGLIVSNRLEVEGGTEQFGLFINTIPFRFILEKNVDLNEDLKKVFLEKNKLYPYKNLPYYHIKSILQEEACIFAFNFTPFSKLWRHNDVIKYSDSFERTNIPFILHLLESKSGDFSIKMSAHDNFIDQEYLSYLMSYFYDSLKNILNNYSFSLSLNSLDYQKILYNWNKTERPFSKNDTITYLFEEQVKQTPDNIAVIYEEKKLTYKELNEKANQLAYYLQNNYAIQNNDLIALCLNRSEKMMVAILGVLKSGAAYVPLDPDYPEERLKYMLEDINAKVILTETLYEANCYACIDGKKITTAVSVIDSDKFCHELRGLPVENLTTQTSGDSLAYVIYTSGTTGKPKGVMIEHSGVVNRIAWMNAQYALKEHDKILQKTPYGFDVSVWELLWGLWYGASIVFAKPEGHRDAEYLVELIKKEEISILHFVPSMLTGFLHLVKNTQCSEKLTSWRYLFCSGEVLHVESVKEIHEYLPWVKVHNLYGPTEASIDVLYYDCTDSAIKKVYIGKPIWNTQAYILDSNLNPLPIGVIGELYIGGIGLARGYLNLPELTAERFVSNPFQTKEEKACGKSSRIYKTGDLALYLPDGNIEYIGRNDFQVKLRGFRIELGEIENLMLQYPGVRQAVVTINQNKKDENQQSYLIGYFVAEKVSEEKRLLEHLARHLPSYMVPTTLIQLTELPLTANGKFNRKALPIPEINLIEDYVAPRNEIENELRIIYADVLNLPSDSLSINANFFSLGGDSILAIKLVSKLNSNFKAKINVKNIFENKNIASLSELILSQVSLIAREKEITYIPFSLKSIAKDKLTDDSQFEDIYPASFLQTGMLLESHLDAKHETYHDVFSYGISCRFDRVKFLSIWEQLVAKHELLRAKFIVNNENGYEVYICKSLSDIDYRIYYRKNPNDLVFQERKNMFDYSRAGLFRLLINQQDEKFDCIFSFHHAIADGWSVASLMSEFIQAYKNNQPIKPNKCHLHYGAFILCELSAVKNKKMRQFWEKYLEGSELIYPKWNFSKKRSKTGLSEYCLRLSSEKSVRVHNLAKIEGVTVDTIFLYSYMQTLSFFFDQQDITIGLVVNNRLEVEGGDEQFGLFLNTIPYRLKLKKLSLKENAIKKCFLEKIKLYEHRQFPYFCIKSIKNENIFNFSFNFINFHVLKESYEDILNINVFERTNIPVVLNVSQDNENRFSLKIVAHDNVADQEYLKYFMEYYLECIDNILNSSPLPLQLNQQDYQRLICDQNNTRRLYSDKRTIQEVFEEQVLKTPQAIAVVDQGVQLTYYQLNERANQLASYLRRTYKIRADDLIALCMDRSECLIISILGILKAGGAYVPLNPDSPAERLLYQLNDMQAKLVLTFDKYKELFNNFIETIVLDDVEILYCLKKESSENLSLNIMSYHLAYVIYTSGTTGNPKGVMIKHSSLLNYIENVREYGLITHNDIVSFSTNIEFDLSVTTTVSALCLGSEIRVYSGDLINIHQYEAYLSNNPITVCKFTPSYFELLIDHLPNTTIKKIILGGEKINKALIQRIKAAYEKAQNILPPILYDEYGPTETTIGSCINIIDFYHDDNLTIGKPYFNTSIYILSNARTLMPLGSIGELYIGGSGLARGYLNRPELTKERFVINVFQTEEEKFLNKNDLIYKTGDFARYLPDGRIEFIGRKDSQIKLRGYRIELEEIEQQLLRYQGINQAAVILHEVNDNSIQHNFSKHLLAYYVSSENIEEENLRIYLSNKLPEYMIPGVFMHIDAMPLSVNGKLDRKKLPLPEIASMNAYFPPRTDSEVRICKIFAEILGLQQSQISIYDDFFRLGGHSISAIHLSHRLSKEFGIHVPVAKIFQAKTVIFLDKIIKEIQIENIVIPKAENINDYPLSFAQERLWFIERYEQGASAYHMPLLLQLSINISLQSLQKSLQAIINRHEILRSIFSENEFGQNFQVVQHADLSIQQILCVSHEAYLKRIQEDMRRPFNLRKEYPIRAFFYKVVKEEKYESYLLINFHHIASDGWSIDIFLNELLAHYRYYLQGKPLSLPKLSIQYKDFSVWQRDFLKFERFTEQLEYWKKRLADFEVLQLPIDKIRPAYVTYEGKRIRFELEERLSSQLKRMAKERGYTMYTLLIAGFYILLYKYCGQKDIIVGTTASNRHYQSIQDLIGFFVNMLAQREILEIDQSVDKLMEQVYEHLTEAQAHQDMPFEQLVQALDVERDASRHPLFQILFTVQNFGRSIKNLDEIGKYSDLEINDMGARFDLECFIDDSKDKITGFMVYAVHLFEEYTVEKIILYYKNILTQMVSDRDKPLQEYQLLTAQDYHMIVHEWNKTENDFNSDKSLVKLFEEQVKLMPNNVAIIYKDICITYQQLNEKVNQVARHLKGKYDLNSDDLIALYLSRSELMIIAILAVLKSGAAYVPLELNYPAQHLIYILKNTHPKIILTETVHQDDCYMLINNEKSSYKIISLDADDFIDELKKQSVENVSFNEIYNELVYVIYTSGTTGLPKGVMQTQEMLINLVNWSICNYKNKASPPRKIAQFANYGFDVSAQEIFYALLQGASLVVLSQDDKENLADLPIKSQAFEIDEIFLPTSVLNIFCESSLKQNIDFKFLKKITVSGEALSVTRVIKDFFIKYEIQLENQYGPTESHVVTSNLLTKDEIINSQVCCIGKPISNCCIYILDVSGQPVPPGVVGELYIGGVGLAKGYLNQPKLTNERFISNPFQTHNEKSREKNKKIYKTGDLARYLSNGSIEYIGRNDFQVKLRGFRVELSEIECRMLLYPGIKQAVAKISDNNINENIHSYLMGYYVSETEIEEKILLEYLANYLPSYMVPTILIHLVELPLTINGKVDKRALPIVFHKKPSDYVVPRNKLEEKICEIFAENLGLSKNSISIEADFFNLGGNSISAARMSYQLNKIFDKRGSIVQVKDIFYYKTVAALSKKVEERILFEREKSKGSDYLYWKKNLENFDVFSKNIYSFLDVNEKLKNFSFDVDPSLSENLFVSCGILFGAQVNDILLTALSLSLKEITNSVTHALWIQCCEEKSLESEDFYEYPICLSVDPASLVNSIRSVKNDMRKAVKNGRSFSYISDDVSYAKPGFVINFFNDFEMKDDLIKRGGKYTDFTTIINFYIKERTIKINIRSKASMFVNRLIQYFKMYLVKIIDMSFDLSLLNYEPNDFLDNFDPYLEFNSEASGKILFLFPPGFGGAESYIDNIISNLSDCRIIAFNNYYKHIKDNFNLNGVRKVFDYQFFVDFYMQSILKIQSTGKYCFLGWSFGGNLALEIARKLVKNGREIHFLGLIDSFFYSSFKLQDARIMSSFRLKYRPEKFDFSRLINNIVLFKAELEQSKEGNVNDDVVAVDNGLSNIFNECDFKIVKFLGDHFEWVKNPLLVSQIVKEVENFLLAGDETA